MNPKFKKNIKKNIKKKIHKNEESYSESSDSEDGIYSVEKSRYDHHHHSSSSSCQDIIFINSYYLYDKIGEKNMLQLNKFLKTRDHEFKKFKRPC